MSETEFPPPLPLCVLLDAHEIASLHSINPPLDSADYTVVSLPIVNLPGSSGVRISERLPDGHYIMGLQVVIPPGFFKESRIIDPRKGGSPLDNTLGLLPSARLVVRIDRLSSITRAEIQRQIDATQQGRILDAPEG